MRPIDADALISDLEYDVELDSRLLDDTGLVGLHRELTQFDKDCKANTIAFLKEAPTVDVEPKWIPCSEKLPDDDRSKVVTLANGNVEAGYYSNGDWWCIGDSISLENPTVIAWMPLPEPYEVEK